MKKSLLLIIGLISILLVACTGDKETRIIEKLDKLYNENLGYETELEMKIIMNNETEYKMIEKYSHDNTISLEILEPEESKGITIEYKDDKIFLNHASIRQSIALRSVKNFDKGILLVNFFENLDYLEFMDEHEIDDGDYYLFKYRPEDTNRYNDERYIYLSKKKLEPYMMEILDKDGNIRAIIKYRDFKYTED